MLLCGLTTKNTPVFSELTSPFVQIGGNRPAHPEFEPRTLWSLTNAFTSAFKELDPMPQFRATANFRLPARRADINRRLPSTTRAHAPAT